MKVLLKCHFPSFCMLLFFLRIHSLYILINEGILENSCVLLGSKLFCSKFDKKSTPPSIEIFLVLCLFRRRAYFQGFVRYGKFILSYHVLFPYLFTLICCSFMLHSDWPKSDSSVDGQPQGGLEAKFKFSKVTASSPFLFCPAAGVPQESLLTGQLKRERTHVCLIKFKHSVAVSKTPNCMQVDYLCLNFTN